MKKLLVESQRELLKLLKPKTEEYEENETTLENETRSSYTSTKTVRITSTHDNDPCAIVILTY